MCSTDTFFVRDRNFYRDLFRLACPIVLQNMISFGISFADNVMIGRLGDNAISGVYLGALVTLVLYLLGIGDAVLILAAQYWGRHDIAHIKDAVSIGMRIAVSVSAVFSVVVICFPAWVIGLLTEDPAVIAIGASYVRIVGWTYPLIAISQILITAMRSVEIVRIGLINSSIAFVVNVFLNYLLIFGHWGFPALGVDGSAYATTAARIVELGVVLYFVLKVDRHLHLSLIDFLRWNKEIFYDLVKFGTPIVCGQLVWAANNVGQRAILGHVSGNALTAASITGILDSMLNLITWGVAGATGVMVGKAVGEGKVALVKQYSRTMQVLFFGFGIFCSLLVWQWHGVFLSFYELSPAAYQLTHQFMLVLVPIMIGRCYQAPLLFGLVKSGGDTAFVFKNDTFWVFTLVLPGGWLAMHYGAPAWFVYLMLLSDQITKCFVAFIKINSYNWIRNLTRPAKNGAK